MMRTIPLFRLYACLAACLLSLALLVGAAAQETAPDPEKMLDSAAQNAQWIETQLEANSLQASEMEKLRVGLEERRTDLAALVARMSEQIAPLQAQLDALGPAPEEGTAEGVEVAQQRARLTGEIAALETTQKRSAQAEARARALADRLAAVRRTRFTQELLARGPTPLAPSGIAIALGSIETYLGTVTGETRERLAAAGAMGSLFDRMALPALLAILGIVLAIGVRRWIVQRLVRAANEERRRARQVGIGFGLTLARLLMPAVAMALVLAGLSRAGITGPNGQALLAGVSTAVALIIGAYALGGAFFSPDASSLRFSRLDNGEARAAHRWLILLAALTGLDRAIVVTAQKANLAVEAISLANLVIICLGAIALWRFVNVAFVSHTETGGRADGKPDTEDEDTEQFSPLVRMTEWARRIARIVSLLAPVLAAAGYFSASRYFFYAPVSSGAVIGFCILLYHVTDDLTRIPPSGPGADEPRQPLIPVAVATLLILAATPVLALIWGADIADLTAAWSRTLDGFRIGEITLSPVDFVIFLLVFIIGYLFTRLIKGVLRRSVLPLTPMDAGGRSAVLAGVGYIGVIISALVAISTTGLDLSNLAIVAGALSVGIGFGLQNIVNNFVSGIILLIERPIKTGDWVEIAGTHGTVKQVNVRSTEIETFDRSSMFVPNADLMSGTVINWTHSNSYGRLIVPVGVAYGSDARQVEKILLEIARGHQMLLRRPAPYVLFKGFGADSLDFEIRAVLRDVNWILNVASDLRYEIYDKFNEAGIEIPFAQRDLHIKNIDQLGGTIRAAIRDGDKTQT